MGDVAQFHDPEGDRLIRLAERLGGPENLSEGERWRLANTLDARRRHEARATQPDGRTDALSSEALERRFAVLETHAQWAEWMLKEVAWQVVGEVINEAEQHAIAEAKKLQDELRIETDQKINANFSGFESVVRELRGEDRAALLATVRETLGDAESRIDTNLANALDKTWERAELEVALVRDELLSVIAEKKFGVFTDDAPKLELAERAIASLRSRTDALETESAQAARSDQLAGVAERLAALEGEHKKMARSLFVRCAANVIAVKKEAARADDLAGKVETLEATMAKLIGALLERKVID